jgi:hypothetical protein
MKRRLSFREGPSGDLEILWCGEDVSHKSWDNIMRQVMRDCGKEGVTFTQSLMVEAFPGGPLETPKRDLDANVSAPLPDPESLPDYMRPEKGEE